MATKMFLAYLKELLKLNERKARSPPSWIFTHMQDLRHNRGHAISFF